MSSLFPYKNFFHVIGTNPDLYGWFWVATTLIFVLAATGNLSTYIGYYFADDLSDWKYDFAKLGGGAAVIYAFVSIVPGLIYIGTKFWLDLEPSLVTHYCIFGYSMFPYIPAAVISFFFLPRPKYEKEDHWGGKKKNKITLPLRHTE